MADVANARGNNNFGTTTPATPGSITAVSPNLLVCIIGAVGTSPTIATPTSAGTWTQVQKTQGATLSAAMYIQPANAGGAINPSSVLGGTVTGWNAVILEFNATGSNCALQGSAQSTQSTAQLTNLFAGQGQMIPGLLFVYTVVRATATIISSNQGLAPINQQGMTVGGPSWSVSAQSIASSGVAIDTYWGTNLAQGAGPFPNASGLLSSAVASVQIGAWLNAAISQSYVAGNIGGSEGLFVGPFFQGMVGG